MHDVERKTEAVIGTLRMRCRQSTGCQPSGQPNAHAEPIDEIVPAAKDQRLIDNMEGQGHADAAANMILQSSRTGETLRGIYGLRKVPAARIEQGPSLAANARILGDAYDTRHMGIAADWKRRTDEPHRLCKQPSGDVHASLEDFA